MARRPEDTIEDEVVEWAESENIITRKMEWVGRRGAPDRFFGKDNKYLVIEFKRKGGRVMPVQVQEHKKFAEAGCVVPIFDSAADAITYLTKELL